MEKQHTPTPIPWILGGISGKKIKSKGHLGFIADVDLKVNAELIVKAVNNHDRLLSMLDKVVNTKEKDLQKLLDIFDEADQLLTELKS